MIADLLAHANHAGKSSIIDHQSIIVPLKVF